MSLKKSSDVIHQYEHTNSIASPNFFEGAFNTRDIISDPYITGYAYIRWLKIPDWVKQEYPNFEALMEKNFRSLSGIGSIEISGVGVNAGFSNSEHQVAGGISNFQGFSTTHREFSGSPVTNAYRHWVSGIRDPRTNIATYPKQYGLDYSTANHTGELIFFNVRPDADNKEKKIIENAVLFTMVMPTKIAMDHMSFTAGTNDGVEIEMPFLGTPIYGQAVDELASDSLAQVYDVVHMNDVNVQ